MHTTSAETHPRAATQVAGDVPPRRFASLTNFTRWAQRALFAIALIACNAGSLWASEADLAIPDLHQGRFVIFGNEISGYNLLLYGSFVICGTLGISLYLRRQIAMLPAHESMLKVAEIIYQTCRTYLIQQGKFLILLFLIIAAAMAYYFLKLQDETLKTTGLVLLFSIIGMIGSYWVAWYGIRVNTYANARTAFASLRGEPLDVVNIPLRAGMSIGLFLISLELVMMVIILLFLPREIVGYCFLGFAIGESLGASVLRIAGGIFTKIADIGSDLMKIVFNVKEDDPRNPGVIADCTGDNAGDSVGPTADGFETYGVTGVALIAFITLAVPNVDIQAKLIVWLFAMRFLMDFMSGVSYFVNQSISETKYRGLKEFDFEAPLTRLIWIAAILCITTSFGMSWLLIGDISVGGKAMPQLWWQLATIIGCGTLAAVLIPEFTKVFTSSHSRHVHEIVTASREGGPSLTILSGIVAGNFSAFWNGMLITGLMAGAYFVSLQGLDELMMVTLQEGLDPVGVGSIFAFGLVAFGFLCMGPVNIAVDSYGPVTDNAQSIFELAQTESIPGIHEQIKRDFGFEPDFTMGKHYLEANDSAGNTFKATAKPVLIGTAVVGATTMIFSIILLLGRAGYLRLSLTDAPVLLGFMAGGSVIYWFCGASMQAVTTGAYRAVEYIKKNMDLTKKEADIEDSKAIVKICTQYAQKGMWNIFITLMAITLAFAFFDPNFFVAYLVSIAVFGLFQAIYMANAGGAWDNAKKLVEVDLKEKGTPLHEASVIGDTVGDPFKDTSSVALNPIIKFSTLFGLLAVEIAVKMKEAAHAGGTRDYTSAIGAVLLAIALVFVWRSFYAMRIPQA
ncbi:sodium-translocating pyrophosphatase [Lacipirellula parvula]|uniref:K(+)-insensitive pyrophosphate-energized proton pump n=1 Tax=Lacipirellula parvula TaxID=2650471 RepID=A0A5K7X464_9BACT|nr:sodium-translocating pyrophosphatase [Lacipirellula parvula]BBO31320.1 pyrophosphate-energized proton pump [Lacipirellula parvula]